MKYFVTGATGFVGSALVRQLLNAGHEVVATVRNPEKAGHLRQMGIKIFQGDITDKESMREAMQGCDGVFHVAGWYKVGARDKRPGQHINIDGTRNILELMQELGIKKGVYTSTLAVNSDTHGKVPDESYHFTGTHISEYDRTKAEAHKIADAFIQKGLPLVILMPGLIYGPEGQSLSDNALRDFLRGRLPVIPKKAAYAWAHVEDIAHSHILAMEKAAPGTTYIVCGPNHTLEEAFRVIASITRKKAPIAIPPAMLKITSLFVSLFEWLIPMPDMYSSEALRVQAGATYLGDNTKAKRELGYQPRPLREGMEQTIHALTGKHLS